MRDRDDHFNWLQLAGCNHLWSLDSRGSRRGVWSLGSGENGSRLFIVGVPYSELS